MKLSSIITEYRKRMQISQREFARRCGLSNSYISFIEKESNPRTGRPIVPTLEQYQNLAAGMGLTVHQLFEQLDEDSPVEILNPSPVPAQTSAMIPEIKIVSELMEEMNQEQREQIVAIVRAIANQQKRRT